MTSKPELRIYIVGVILVIASLIIYASSIYYAATGRVVASLVGTVIGSVTLIVGADLVKGQR